MSYRPQKKRLWHSFQHALNGISYVMQTQSNMRIHFFIAAAVIILAMTVDVPVGELIWVIFAILFVMCMETLNTAIERMVDLITPHYHPLAKLAKDIAAGAVLFASVFAIATGLIVFTGPVLALFNIALSTQVHVLVLILILCFIVSFWLVKPARMFIFFIMSSSVCITIFLYFFT